MILHEKKLIFIHIPKTGGGTIHKVFGQKFRGVGNHYDNLYPDMCQDYFMFTFVRNPFERFLSGYMYWGDIRNLLGGISFLEYARNFHSIFKKACIEPRPCKTCGHVDIDSGTPKEIVHTWDMSYLNGHEDKWKYVDFVGRYESFEKDLTRVMEIVGCEPPDEMPKEHRSTLSENEKPYSWYYCDESKYLVEQMFRMDLDRFEYRF